MRLTNEELDLLAVAYAHNCYIGDKMLTHRRPSLVNGLVSQILSYGLITEEVRNDHASAYSKDFWLVRPSARGVRFVRAYDPVKMIRSFIRADCTSCAVLWILSRMNSLGEFPEFLTHWNASIRAIAKVRFDYLVQNKV